MQVKMLKSLCFMRLKTAGIVIGWLGAVVSFIAMLVLSYGLGSTDCLHTEIAIAIVVTIIHFLSSGMLIIGTKQERHLMLLPWLIHFGLALVYGILLYLNIVIYAMGSVKFIYVGIYILMIRLILALLNYIYFGICSLFKELQLTRKQQLQLINQPQALIVPNPGNTYPSHIPI